VDLHGRQIFAVFCIDERMSVVCRQWIEMKLYELEVSRTWIVLAIHKAIAIARYAR
jgi:hypothetical protein